MGFSDWFKKAKAEKEKVKEPKNKYGNLASGSKAYDEAKAALDDEDKNRGQYASNE